MLDRLMRRAIFSKTDAVMGEDVDHRQLRKRCQADGRSHIIGEYQERRAVGDHATMQGQAVEDGPHAVFTHAEVDVPAATMLRAELARATQKRIVRCSQVGRATDEVGNYWGDRIEHTP